MCGIFALFGPKINVNVYAYFKRGDKRGPEGSILEVINHNYIGFHRLAINGVDNVSGQPMHYKEYVLVCNGEIFNYKALIEKYGLNVTTKSDCEVILYLYELLKEKCVQELDGEFSFIIYDKEEDSIFIARDHFGVRPLYVNHVNKNICFCSDIEPMKCLPLINIKQFPPGNYAKYKTIGGVYKEVYTTPYFICHKTFYFKEPEPVSQLTVYEALMEAIIKRVAISDRPVACLLSGGLDSSIVSAVAARYYKEITGKPIETFSIGLEDSEDLKYSKKVAEHIGSNHTQIICTEEDFLTSIPDVIVDIESYDTTTVRASVGNWNIGKYIRNNSLAKVILNGDGADELMGGYLYFHKCPDSTEFDKECVRLLNHIQYFDVLRSDKCISSHGLEARTPYLDRKFVEAYLSLYESERCHSINEKQEKYLIREIIKKYDPNLLPDDILYRKKEAFSDGVSSLKKSWYEIIQENVKYDESNETLYLHNSPKTVEQKCYRSEFEYHYKDCGHLIPYFWMPKYIKATDASARTLSIY
jgi:asparagine synthase (glutamine-hydrolysing)